MIINLHILTCLICFSCEKEIKLKFNGDDEMLVVNSIICPDSLVTVKVSYSQSILENQPTNYVTTAKVLLFENGVLLDSLVLVEKGKYQSKFKPKAYKIYSLQVSDGASIVTAKCQIPEKALKFHAIPDTTYNQFGRAMTGIKIQLKDDINQNNFYRILMRAKYASSEGAGTIVFSYNDEALNNQTSALDAINNYINDEARNYNRIELVFSDKSISGANREIQLSELHVGKCRVYIYLQTLSEDYYKYLYTYKNQPKDAYSDHVAVHSNIETDLAYLLRITK